MRRQEIQRRKGRYVRHLSTGPRLEPLEGRRLFAGMDWSTFIGGSGQDSVVDVAVVPDGSGDVVVTGTSDSDDFPPGGEARPEGGGAYVARVSGDGSRLVYAAFLPGVSSPLRVAVAPDGSPVVAGQAHEEQFTATPGAYQTEGTGDGVFVVKFDPTGREVVFASLFGGTDSEALNGVAVDSEGGVVVAGYTSSADFPTTESAFDRTLNAGGEVEEGDLIPSDAFVARLSPDGSDLTYGTFLGGEGDDEANAVTVDSRGFVTVAGETNPAGEDEDEGGNVIFLGEPFPTTAGAFRREFQGQEDGFVARLKLDGDGSGDLRYGSILGSSGEDVAHGLAFDPRDPRKVVVSGRTDGWNWPTTRGAFQRTRLHPETEGNPDLTVTAFRFNSSRGGRLEWSTLHGQINGYLYFSDVDVDRSGNVLIAGAVETSFGTLVDRPTTQGAFDRTPDGGAAFLTRLSPGGQRLLYETFIDNAATGIEPRVAAVDSDSAVIAGTTFSDEFPTTDGAFDTVLNDGGLVSNVPGEGYVARFTFGPLDPDDTSAEAPRLLSPRNGARFPAAYVEGAGPVTFDWTDVNDASGVRLYELEVMHNAEFETQSETSESRRIVVRTTESQADVVFDQVFHSFGDDVLCWRVRTLDNANNFSRWSSVRRIELGELAEPRLAAMEISPDGVTGGSTARGKVLLEGFAPQGGTTLTLSTSDPDLVDIPETVTVPEGESSVTFPVTTRRVTRPTAVWVQAELGEEFAAPVLWIDPPRGSEQRTTVYQAESAARRGAIVSSGHRGFTGNGYLDFRNASGDYADFTVSAAAAGQHTLTFRYANGGRSARTMGLSVNGASIPGGVRFGPTGSWSDWRDVSITVQLTEGTNRIRLTATGQSGPNLDSLTVTG